MAFGLVQLTQTELVRAGFFGSCSRRHTAHVMSMRLGGDIGGLTSISGAADRSRRGPQRQGGLAAPLPTLRERWRAGRAWGTTLHQSGARRPGLRSTAPRAMNAVAKSGIATNSARNRLAAQQGNTLRLVYFTASASPNTPFASVRNCGGRSLTATKRPFSPLPSISTVLPTFV